MSALGRVEVLPGHVRITDAHGDMLVPLTSSDTPAQIAALLRERYGSGVRMTTGRYVVRGAW